MGKLTNENLLELEKRYRMTILTVFAQILVTIILTVAAWVVVNKTEISPSEQTMTTLWVAILFIAGGSFVLRRLFNGWDRLRNAALLNGVSGVLGLLQKNAVILGVFAEIISIIGFVITVFSGNSSDMFRSAAIALVVFFINFPRKKVWKTIVSNLQEV
jgi:hypothetical protein